MSFLDYYNSVRYLVNDVQLVFEFNENLKGIKYYANERGVLKEYLDSACFVRDREQLAQNKVWLDLKNDFNKKIIVGYKDLWFFCYESVWSPSIDAIFLIDTLLGKEKFGEQKIDSILDFGCGTGVMGISLAKFNQSVKSIYLLDSNKYALYSSLINAIGNNVNCQYNVLNSLDGELNIEIGIVTPYYFPIIKDCTTNHYDKIIYAGIESANLTNMVADKVKTTYFIYSSTTETQFLQSLKHNHSVIGELLVPFTLGDNVSNQQFLNTALENDILIYRDVPQFKYWHKIYVGKIQK